MSVAQIATIAVLGLGGYYVFNYGGSQSTNKDQPNYNYPGSTSVAVITDRIDPVLPKNTTLTPIDTDAAAAWNAEETKWIADYTKTHMPGGVSNGHFQTITIDPVRADQMFQDYKKAQTAAAAAAAAIKNTAAAISTLRNFHQTFTGIKPQLS